MLGFTLVNDVTATVATQSNSASVSLVVGSGQGAAFASATVANPIRCGAFDSTGVLKFFFDVTARSTDTLTVANRGAESTIDANILTTDVIAAVTTAGVLANVSNMQLIGETILGSTASSITFSSIPGTYRSLRLLANARSNKAAANEAILLRFNSDSGNNYDYQRLYGLSSQVAADFETAAQNGAFLLWAPAASTGQANASGAYMVEIPYYARTNFNKSGVVLAGFADSTTANDLSGMASFNWRNTAAITSVSLVLTTGSFVVGTSAALYGVV